MPFKPKEVRWRKNYFQEERSHATGICFLQFEKP